MTLGALQRFVDRSRLLRRSESEPSVSQPESNLRGTEISFDERVRIEPDKREYRIGEFFGLPPADFVNNVFASVLKRGPNAEELRTYTEVIERDSIDGRLALLHGALSSGEAKTTGIRIHGLTELQQSDNAPLHLDPSRLQYSASELLLFNGSDFVQAMYVALLKRQPSDAEVQHWFELLGTGTLPKSEALANIMLSPEAKRVGTTVSGLDGVLSRSRVFRIPIVGPILHLLALIKNLPSIERQLRSHSFSIPSVAHAPNRMAKREASILKKDVEALSERFATLLIHWKESGRGLVRQQRELEGMKAALKMNGERFDLLVRTAASKNDLLPIINELASQRASVTGLDSLRQQVSELLTKVSALADCKAEVADLTKLAEVLDTAKATTEELDKVRQHFEELFGSLETRKVDNNIDFIRSEFYPAFEDEFRGPRELILNRQKVYIEYLRRAGIGGETKRVLDIGCGRGEFLEILRANQLHALGVDANSEMVTRCRELGLLVEHSEGLEYLKNLTDSSLGAISSFHVIEHLSLAQIQDFLVTAFLKLQPGGLLLLETPNPLNLTVGATTFWIDPSHIRPLPPALVRFLCESAGFDVVDVIEMNPVDERYAVRSNAERLRWLLLLEGDDFLTACYETILKRTPDRQGFDHYKQMLTGGSSKTQVIEHLLETPEARAVPGPRSLDTLIDGALDYGVIAKKATPHNTSLVAANSEEVGEHSTTSREGVG